jgi:hypothetical protein
MAWLFGAVFLFAILGALAFALTRAPAGSGRKNGSSGIYSSEAGELLSVRRDPPDIAATEAERLNSLVKKNLPETAEESKSYLLPLREHMENDEIADSLEEVHKRAVLPQAPKTYLRMVERDDAIDRLLSPHVRPPRGYTLPAREFWIETTEERKDSDAPGISSPVAARPPKTVRRLAFAARALPDAEKKKPEQPAPVHNQTRSDTP